MLKNTITIFIVIFVTFALFNLARAIQDAFTAGERLNKASDELQAMQEQNRNLKTQLQLQQTPDFIETQAREKLNLSKENETIFIIDTALLAQYLESTPSPTPSPSPNYQGWLKLFGFQ